VSRLSLSLILLLLLAAWFDSSAAAQGPEPFAVGELQRCSPPQGPCRSVPIELLGPSAGETTLVRTVTAGAAAHRARPLMVRIIATASSEIRWNGVIIGRNGVPGPDRARERPGRFIATFVVPHELVKPGINIVSARISSHHLWLPIRRTVHAFDVTPYDSSALPGLTDYLAALLMMGALAATGIYFAAAAALDRGERGARLLAGIAGLALIQLAAETARTFVAYSYPWHLVRVGAIALLSSLIAILIAAYGGRRFAPSLGWKPAVATGMVAILALLLIPWYDIKALASILAGAIALLACTAVGSRQGRRDARLGMAIAAAIVALLASYRTEFLDGAWYLILALLLVGLVAEQLLILRQARVAYQAEEQRSSDLEDRLRKAEEPPLIVSLKDGSRTLRIAEADILFVKAADDYAEVQLKGGRALLVTMTLARVHALLSERFVRVHKSYVVNRRDITAIAPRAGGGRELTLSDGSSLPVGRSYVGVLAPLAMSS
jgi:hypothetical protein